MLEDDNMGKSKEQKERNGLGWGVAVSGQRRGSEPWQERRTGGKQGSKNH